MRVSFGLFVMMAACTTLKPNTTHVTAGTMSAEAPGYRVCNSIDISLSAGRIAPTFPSS
ncbi:MAG TPA: hypothetical protein VGK20_06810 [Candidatus Binatia bacterium]